MHAMQEIAETGSKPMVATPIPMGSLDDKMVGNMLANEVIATVKQQANAWPRLVGKLFVMTVEARKYFIEAIDTSIKAMKETVKDDHSADAKRAAKVVNSATVYVSQMKKIAQAVTAGMDQETVVRAWLDKRKSVSSEQYDADVKDTLAHFEQYIGIAATYQTALEFVGAAAGRGRKPDTFLVKLSKFLKANEPKEDTDPADAAAWKDVVEFYNTKVKT